jgi:predicted nucleic acid-binding protein
LRATLQKPRVDDLTKPYTAGRLVNQIKRLAEDVSPLPRVKRSPDPNDDFLLAMSEAGNADYLVTGDKSGLSSSPQSNANHCRRRLCRVVRMDDSESPIRRRRHYLSSRRLPQIMGREL